MKKYILYILTAIFFGYWLILALTHSDPDGGLVAIFSSSYIVIALCGGIFGVLQSRKWGGFKSLLGKSLGLLSLGLILISMGELVLTFYYYVLNSEPPYPSVAEIFFISAIAVYVIAVFLLAKIVGAWKALSSKNLPYRMLVFTVPIAMIICLLAVYVAKHGQGDAGAVAMVTDFIYAILQGVYALMAILVLLNTQKLFGGSLRKAVILLLIALMIQYAADTNVSFQTLAGTWHSGGYGELIYIAAYALMALSIQMFTLPKASQPNAQSPKVEGVSNESL